MIMDILTQVSRFCREHSMLPREGTVLVGLSGGADSMCLLSILKKLSEKHGFAVAAAHFNHNLRGAESDADALFVREYCRENGIAVFMGSGDVKERASSSGETIEEAARSLRYEFFAQAREESGACRIATAHNADDNLETVILRLARGTGLKGLCGIPPVRDDIIRPLLCVSRAEIEAYLAENGIPHREDSSNLSDDYARNRVRHHVMPVLRALNPSAASAASVTTRLLSRDEEHLSSEAQAFLEKNLVAGGINAEALSSAPFPIASRAVRMMLSDGLSAGHVDDVLALSRSASPSAKLDLPGCTVRREYGMLYFSPAEAPTFAPFTLSPGEHVFIEELGVTVSCEKSVFSGSIHKTLTSFLFKSENVCGIITVRPRLAGDRIRLSPSGGSKSLKKLFIDKKIPAHLRASLPVIADEFGPLAVCGVGSDLRSWPKIGDEVLKVTFKEIKNYD